MGFEIWRNIFGVPARESDSDKSQSPGECKSCAETNAQGLVPRAGDGGAGRMRERDGLCKCGHLVGNQFSPLPFIHPAPAFAIYTRPPVEIIPLSFSPISSWQKKKEKKKKKKLAHRKDCNVRSSMSLQGCLNFQYVKRKDE